MEPYVFLFRKYFLRILWSRSNSLLLLFSPTFLSNHPIPPLHTNFIIHLVRKKVTYDLVCQILLSSSVYLLMLLFVKQTKLRINVIFSWRRLPQSAPYPYGPGFDSYSYADARRRKPPGKLPVMDATITDVASPSSHPAVPCNADL